VQLYELSPGRMKRHRLFAGLRGLVGRLHAKTAVIDRRLAFFGSMNFDERSASVNTEMGVFVDSPQLAEELRRVMMIDRQQAALRLVLAPDGSGLQWWSQDESDQPEQHPEPGIEGLLPLLWRLLEPLAPESLL